MYNKEYTKSEIKAMLIDEMKRFFKESKEHYLTQNHETGMFTYEMYADYRDELDESTIKKLMSENEPRYAFYEYIHDMYIDEQCDVEYELANAMQNDENIKVLAELYMDTVPNCCDTFDVIREIMIDSVVSIEVPSEHYMEQSVKVDIIVDTGDLNYDYSLNCVYPHYNGRVGETIDDKAAIVWLTKQQGYKKSDLNKALREEQYKDSKFLKSINSEVANCSTHMNALTFCVELSINELCDLQDKINKEKELNNSYDPKLRKGKEYVTISKDTECGLYDCWNGAGSMLDLELEKDVKLPIKYIDTALPDGARGYGIDEIYGCGNIWKTGSIQFSL